MSDHKDLPENLIGYSQTPVFTEKTAPAKLTSVHDTKPGVWGKLVVLDGELDYVTLGNSPVRKRITPLTYGVIAPAEPHRIDLVGPVRFQVEFYRAPSNAPPADSDRPVNEPASSPCFLGAAETAYSDLGGDATHNVAQWRKKERMRLISLRTEMSLANRRRCSEDIAAQLKSVIGEVGGRLISFYWPIRGEPDLRAFMEDIANTGAAAALPVVVAKGEPLAFRAWSPGEPLERGVWGIPVPSASARAVAPEIMLAPVVGFDPDCYRLGYGGGYFDRTLASFADKPRVIGVGYEVASIESIYPQPHDIPMDFIVTERRVLRS